MYEFAVLLLRFIFYSFCGYLIEEVYCSYLNKKLVNRGFFCGPIIPIYGFGAIAMVGVMKLFNSNIPLAIVMAILIPTVIEYFTSWALEVIFHNKWWDYSKEKFNLNGRICLKNSLFFAIGAILAYFIVDPFIDEKIRQMSPSTIGITTGIIYFIFLIDIIYSFYVAYNLRNEIIESEKLKSEKLMKIPGMVDVFMKNRIKGIKMVPRRILDAFPIINDSHSKYFQFLENYQDKLHTKKKKKK